MRGIDKVDSRNLFSPRMETSNIRGDSLKAGGAKLKGAALGKFFLFFTRADECLEPSLVL